MDNLTTESFGFDELGQLIKRVWKPAFLGAFLLGGAAVATSFLLTPTYRAATVLEYNGDPTQQVGSGGGLGDLGGFASIAGFSVGASGGQKETALAYLESKKFARRFIEDEKIFDVLNVDKWDEDTQAWKKEPTMWATVERFHKDVLRVNEDPKTGLIVVTIEWRDPALAALWAEKLVVLLNNDLRERSVTETQSSLDYLRGELARTSNPELQRVIAGLMEGKIEALMFAGIRDEFAFRTIDPAIAPPDDEPVAPKRLYFLILGLFAGGLAGTLFALLFSRNRRVSQAH